MANNTIKCPNCGEEIEVTDALSSQLKEHLEQELKQKEAKLTKELEAKNQLLQKREQELEQEVAEKLKSEKTEMWKKAQEAAKKQQETEFKDLSAQLKEQQEKLEEAQKAELEFRKQKRDLEEKERNLKLEVERELDKSRSELEEKVRKAADEEQRLKIAEKDKQMQMLQKTIEDLKRKSEQGSMQIQGEVQEEDLKEILMAEFLYDGVDDVPTGINGADLVHTVKSQMGKKAGVILWESKNTKAFSSKWLKKLKDDQMATKADICVLVTQAMPEDVESFGMMDGVWVTNYSSAIDLAHVLRQQILQVNQVRSSLQGQDEKINYLMEYLSSPQFRNRIENLVSAFKSMKDDLETEKRSLNRIWNKREKEIERMMQNTVGVYGDLQGIVGSSIAQVQSLELGGDLD